MRREGSLRDGRDQANGKQCKCKRGWVLGWGWGRLSGDIQWAPLFPEIKPGSGGSTRENKQGAATLILTCRVNLAGRRRRRGIVNPWSTNPGRCPSSLTFPPDAFVPLFFFFFFSHILATNSSFILAATIHSQRPDLQLMQMRGALWKALQKVPMFSINNHPQLLSELPRKERNTSLFRLFQVLTETPFWELTLGDLSDNILLLFYWATRAAVLINLFFLLFFGRLFENK